MDDIQKVEQQDIEGDGQSTGTPAEGAMDVGAREPIETRGLHHWHEATITEPGLGDRGNVFFAAIEMTRMPMILTDPHQPDNPIVFANKAFLDPRASGLDVLGKPYRRVDLLDRIRQALEQRGVTGQRRHRSEYGSAEE